MKYFVLFIKKTLRFLLKPLSFLPAICIMYMIFTLSGQEGAQSASLSGTVSYKVVRLYAKFREITLSPAETAVYAELIHHYIRKAAHIIEYFLLGISVALPLYVYKIRGVFLYLTSALICVGFAALDEYHQSFIVGRSSQARDVLIDCIGIFPGIILCHILGYIGRKTIFSPLSLDRHKNDRS